MAITPRSKGLGNIGTIANRQRMAAPTRPVAKAPMPKPVTTTFAQRKAAPSPFRSATKPVAKVNPMAGIRVGDNMDRGPMVPTTPGPIPDPSPGQMPNLMPGLNPQLPPQFNQPFNGPVDYGFETPTLTPPQLPGLPYFPGAGNFNPMPMDDQQATGQQLANIGMQGLGQMFSNISTINGQPVNQMFSGNIDTSGMPGPVSMDTSQGGAYAPMDMFNSYQNAMFNNPGVDYQEYDQSGNVNPLQQAFNPTSTKNPSNRNSGSLFGSGGFADNG